MIVLDTDVVSELMKSSPDPHVLSWVDALPAGEVWITAMTAAELLAGVAALPAGLRRRDLGIRVGTLLADVFAGRILAFDENAAVAYAEVLVKRRDAGAPVSTADAVIAATCSAAGATRFATRNLTDFESTGLELVDPWVPATQRLR